MSGSANSAAVLELGQETGDRFAISINSEVRAGRRIPIPKPILAAGIPIEALEDESGKSIAFSRASESLDLPKQTVLPLEHALGAWLEYRGPGLFRLVTERRPETQTNGEVTTEQGVKVTFDPGDWDVLQRGSTHATLPEFELALRAARLVSETG